MSPAIFYQLLLCAVILAVYLFTIQVTELFSFGSLVSFVGILCIVGPTYIYCMLSENITIKIYEIGDGFYNIAWYRLPIKQQKLFILPIQRSQSEFRLMGLGLVDCSLGVFSAVSEYSTSKSMENRIFFQICMFSGQITDYSKGIVVLYSDADIQVKLIILRDPRMIEKS